MELEGPHNRPGMARRTRMRSILIEDNPHRLVGIPSTEALHEPTHMLSIFGGHKSPTDPAGIDFIERKQIEFAFRLLRPRQDEPFFSRIASPSIGFDGDDFDIKKEEQPLARSMPP